MFQKIDTFFTIGLHISLEGTATFELLIKKQTVMKKNIQLVGLFLLTGFVFSCNNANKSEKEVVSEMDIASITPTETKTNKNVFHDFIYDIGPRFGTIKKSEVDNAKTIEAFLGEKNFERMQSISSVTIFPFVNEERLALQANGTTKELNESQLKMLRDFGYSSSFVVRVDFTEISEATGELIAEYTSPHLTIVPEKQTTFVDGEDALKAFLKMSTEEVRKNVDVEKFKPAKMYFTVAKDGSIKNVRLDRSSGYPDVDEKMKELIKQVPGTWLPAENAKGEKVDQELVVSFGTMGC